MKPQKPLFRLMSYMRPHRRQTIWATFCSVLNQLFDIAPEILIGMAIDVVTRQEASFVAQFGLIEPWHQILALAGLTLFIWVGESVFEYLYMINWRGLAQTVQHELRLDTYRQIQKLDLAFFENQSTGNLVSIVNDDINQLERFLDGGANQLIQTMTSVIGVGAVFFYISPLIASAAFLPIPLVIIGAFYFQKRATPLYAAVRDKVGDISARLNNGFSGIMTIKSFTSEDREVALLAEASQEYVHLNKKAIAVSSAFIPVIRMAILAGFLATFVLGGWLVFRGDLHIGAYGVLVFLTQRLLWPLTHLAVTIDLYERAMASTRRILDLLKTPVAIPSGEYAPTRLEGRFEFKDVHFQYESGPEVLKGLTLVIEAKKTTAFVGSTGSGKSSLIKQLLRFYEPTRGQLLLDGRPLSEYQIQSLRARIGLVSQDDFLFPGTIRENLLYGNPEATEQEMIQAARLAEAHYFITQLHQGYGTVIGERGQKLSGGQRQRLSIARALLKNPDILILDEATSSVDNETEAAIQRALAVISKDRTTIVIAHRLSTVVHADCIYVLEGGQIQEMGTHSELIAKDGFYSHLWRVQTGMSVSAHSRQAEAGVRS